jgi:hypothetical protein
MIGLIVNTTAVYDLAESTWPERASCAQDAQRKKSQNDLWHTISPASILAVVRPIFRAGPPVADGREEPQRQSEVKI